MAPRSTPAGWLPAQDRAGPLEILAAADASRVPELVTIRRERMASSPLAFFEGAAAVMAADLAPLPRTGLEVQLCGDAHAGNFGAFAAPDRRLVFGVDDFDETLPGPFEWDVMRLVAGVEIAARLRGLDRGELRETVRRTGRAYRAAIAKLAGMRTLEVWYARLEVDEMTALWGKVAERDAALRSLERPRTGLAALDRLTRDVGGERKLASEPPLLVPVGELDPAGRLEEAVRAVFRAYREGLADDRRAVLERFRYADAARKVVGIGSVGTRTWLLMLVGRNDDDPLFLQLKEAGPSVLEPHLGASSFESHGRRVVVGQRLTQAASDLLLGWTSSEELEGRSDYYVRQLWDGKARADPERMEPETLAVYGEVCGWALAHAHARSGDPVAIAGYLGHSDSYDEALEGFAVAYADQNDADYASFRRSP